MKSVLHLEAVWDPGPRYAQGIVSKMGNLLFISGQTAVDSDNKIIGKGDIEAQTRAVLRNIAAIVEQAGGSLQELVATTSYLTDRKFLAGFYKTRREFFAAALPTSTTVVVNGLARREFLVEIEAIAAL